MKIEREKDPRVSDGMVGMTRRRGRIGSRGFSFGKNLEDWALFFSRNDRSVVSVCSGDVDISEWMFIQVVIWRYRG